VKKTHINKRSLIWTLDHTNLTYPRKRSEFPREDEVKKGKIPREDEVL
jgi:hypothetical protein